MTATVTISIPADAAPIRIAHRFLKFQACADFGYALRSPC